MLLRGNVLPFLSLLHKIDSGLQCISALLANVAYSPQEQLLL